MSGQGRLIEEVKTHRESLPRPAVVGGAFGSVVWQGLAWCAFAAVRWLDHACRELPGGAEDKSLAYLSYLIASAAVVTLPAAIKSLSLALRHSSVKGSLSQIGKALLESLLHAGITKTDPSEMSVSVDKGPDGSVLCTLRGATTYETKLFLDALNEILDPVENPRYLIVRTLMMGARRTTDYRAVPSVLGRKKVWAQHFSDAWKRNVGQNALVYTRTIEGRRALLQARNVSLSPSFRRSSDRQTCWK